VELSYFSTADSESFLIQIQKAMRLKVDKCPGALSSQSPQAPARYPCVQNPSEGSTSLGSLLRGDVSDRHSGSMMTCLATLYLGWHSTVQRRLPFAYPRPIQPFSRQSNDSDRL
jgi:hypothetical protein